MVGPVLQAILNYGTSPTLNEVNLERGNSIFENSGIAVPQAERRDGSILDSLPRRVILDPKQIMPKGEVQQNCMGPAMPLKSGGLCGLDMQGMPDIGGMRWGSETKQVIGAKELASFGNNCFSGDFELANDTVSNDAHWGLEDDFFLPPPALDLDYCLSPSASKSDPDTEHFNACNGDWADDAVKLKAAIRCYNEVSAASCGPKDILPFVNEITAAALGPLATICEEVLSVQAIAAAAIRNIIQRREGAVRLVFETTPNSRRHGRARLRRTRASTCTRCSGHANGMLRYSITWTRQPFRRLIPRRRNHR